MIRLYSEISHIKILSLYFLYIFLIYLWDILEYLLRNNNTIIYFSIVGIILLLLDIFISYKINKISFSNNDEIYSLKNLL